MHVTAAHATAVGSCSVLRTNRSMRSRERLSDVLRDDRFDWVTITSPEAATVFREGWLAAGQPAVHIAVVGAGTGTTLSGMESSGALDPAFTPTTVIRSTYQPGDVFSRRLCCAALQR